MVKMHYEKVKNFNREREREREENSRVREDWTNGIEATIRMTKKVGTQVSDFLSTIFVELRNQNSNFCERDMTSK